MTDRAPKTDYLVEYIERKRFSTVGWLTEFWKEISGGRNVSSAEAESEQLRAHLSDANYALGLMTSLLDELLMEV